MKVNIDALLQQRKRSRYWLSKEINVAYTTMKKLADNKTESISFKILENICVALECTPNDLLEVKTKR